MSPTFFNLVHSSSLSTKNVSEYLCTILLDDQYLYKKQFGLQKILKLVDSNKESRYYRISSNKALFSTARTEPIFETRTSEFLQVKLFPVRYVLDLSFNIGVICCYRWSDFSSRTTSEVQVYLLPLSSLYSRWKHLLGWSNEWSVWAGF